MNKPISSVLASVDRLEASENRQLAAEALSDEIEAVAMNAVGMIVGVQERRFFSGADMKAKRAITAILKAIPTVEADATAVVSERTMAPSPTLDRIADAAAQEPSPAVG